MKAILTLITLVVLLWSCASSTQTPYVAENAPPDKPYLMDESGINSFEDAIKPYIEKARRSYPQARERFLAGLPPEHSFFVTTRLRDDTGKFEQAFIAVQKINDGTITGVIWSDIYAVKGYKLGDRYEFPESDLIDWLITHPDGTEEGNYVGNFIDEYQKSINADR